MNCPPLDSPEPSPNAVRRRARRGRPPKDAEPRRSRIIAEASTLFIARGFAATTLDDVGKAAGLNKRAIYELVGDKEQLFREVCRHSYSAIGEADPVPSIGGHSLLASLQALARRLIEHACSDQTIALERLVIAESKRFPELIKEIVQAGHLEGNRSIAAYLAELRNLGMIEFDDLWQASELFYDLIIGQIGLRKVLGHTNAFSKDNHIDNRVDLFIKLHNKQCQTGLSEQGPR